ncbi:extracellular solute-binding protein [Glaciibacter flavus]|uniref:Extracellular solute-binding protein n=1 Tax=Orlajensenia flava TaxID=2565934 RepID=A0A4S4FQS5_9MICO|nr:extracellular solute-binding protein [Glaciibacter flavus]THG32661.1 extracellular solute-binding protein [Glaciibacter flavus]
MAKRLSGARKRGIVGAIGAAAALALLSGCTSGSTPSDTGAVTGKLEILVSSATASDKAFKEVNTAFMKKYPDVKVEFSAVPNDNFPASRSSRLTAGNVDVTLAAPREMPSYVKNGAVDDDTAAAEAGLFVDLTGQDFLKNFTPSVIDQLKYKGKDYTVPTGLSYYTGVFYNKKIFDDNGLSVPTTWSEFEKVMSTLQGAGVTPLGIGGKDSWPAGLDMIAAVQGLYPTADDKTKLAEDLWKGKADLADGKQLEVMKRVSSLYDVAQKNFAGVGYDAIPSGFASGQFAMTVDGTWNQTTIDSAVKGAFDYGYFPLPVSDTAADNQYLGGKVELRMVAAANGHNKTAALAYLSFFSQPDVYTKFIQTTGFAPAEPNIPASEFLKGIEKYTSTFSPAWDTVWRANPDAGQAAVFPFNYPAISPLGGKSAADAAAEAQSAWKAGL